MIPYGRHSIDKNDFNSLKKCINTGQLTQGEFSKKFEKDLSKFVRSKYSVSVNNASNGLILAVRSLNLDKNSIAWTVSNSYVATANSILHNNLKIDFVDINYKTMNICPNDLENKLLKAKKQKRLPKLLITVHFAGQPCDQKKIFQLSKKYGFKIIEDASHALGASYNKEKIGSCKFADLTVFSFHPVKTITTAEGGIITTNKKYLFETLIMLRENGITKKNQNFILTKNWPYHYEQHLLGFNFRLADLNDSIGISQLKRINEFIYKRNKIYNFYMKNLNNLPIDLPSTIKNTKSSHHLFVIRTESKRIRNKLMEYLYKKKIQVNLHYTSIHKQPYFKKIKFFHKNLINSDLHSDKSISIPIYYDLTHKNQNYVIDVIRKFYK